MFFPLPGSFAIPSLGDPSVLLALDARQIALALAFVGVSLVLGWTTARLQCHDATSCRHATWLPRLRFRHAA